MMANDSSINVNNNEIGIVLKDNCSTYNPCDTHGYCQDNLEGEWTCECKFWWNGTLCETLTSGGKQVIALGVITAFLVGLFFGLTVLLWINKKRKERAKDKKISTLQLVSWKSSTRVVTYSSRQILPWIIAIATLILGTSVLIIKWMILNSIHQEIIYKYNTNQSLFYNRPSICRIIYLQEEFNLFTFPIACLLSLLFVVITKRQSSQHNRCYKGYFAIPIPLDFFAHVKRTFAAVTFAIVADELSTITNQLINGNTSSIGDGVILNYMVQIIRVLAIGFRCYPILVAVYINTPFTLICASLYAWFDFSLTVAFQGVCRNDYYSTNDNYNQTGTNDTIAYLDYYGTGSKLIFFQLLTDIPRYLFFAYICIELPMLLFKRIRYRNLKEKELTREQANLLYSSLPYSSEAKYVENLLGLREKKISTNRLTRFVRFIYSWRDDFRFSSRVFCVYASIFCLLFFLTVQACVQVPPHLDQLRNSFQALINSLTTPTTAFESSSQQAEDSSSDFLVPHLVRPYLFAISTALVVTTIQLFVLLVAIRRNLLQVFRGDDSEIPRRQSSQNVDYACGNIHFAGYLIGYVLWGYILIVFLVMIVGVIVDVVITYGMVRFAESFLKIIIPPILFAVFQVFMNRLLAQYVFLQEMGDVLSINHRRILMIFLYFNFFLDAFLGFISSILRIIRSTIGGIIYTCRLDYSLMGRKLETLDAGFSAYCGFIHMECAHRHPVLLYFSSLLVREYLYRTRRCSRARRRWYLAILLLKNPTLIYRRKRFVVQSQTDETRMRLTGRKNMKTMYTEEPTSTIA